MLLGDVMKFEVFSVYYDVVLTDSLNSEVVEFVEPFGLRFKWY